MKKYIYIIFSTNTAALHLTKVVTFRWITPWVVNTLDQVESESCLAWMTHLGMLDHWAYHLDILLRVPEVVHFLVSRCPEYFLGILESIPVSQSNLLNYQVAGTVLDLDILLGRLIVGIGLDLDIHLNHQVAEVGLILENLVEDHPMGSLLDHQMGSLLDHQMDNLPDHQVAEIVLDLGILAQGILGQKVLLLAHSD